MRKRPRNVGREILLGLRQLKRGKVGRVVTLPPIADIRGRTGLSQAEFSRLLGVSVRTLQEWEQGRRAPSGPARMLLASLTRIPRSCSSPRRDEKESACRHRRDFILQRRQTQSVPEHASQGEIAPRTFAIRLPALLSCHRTLGCCRKRESV